MSEKAGNVQFSQSQFYKKSEGIAVCCKVLNMLKKYQEIMSGIREINYEVYMWEVELEGSQFWPNDTSTMTTRSLISQSMWWIAS